MLLIIFIVNQVQRLCSCRRARIHIRTGARFNLGNWAKRQKSSFFRQNESFSGGFDLILFQIVQLAQKSSRNRLKICADRRKKRA